MRKNYLTGGECFTLFQAVNIGAVAKTADIDSAQLSIHRLSGDFSTMEIPNSNCGNADVRPPNDQPIFTETNRRAH